jgi:hypothetical protein
MVKSFIVLICILFAGNLFAMKSFSIVVLQDMPRIEQRKFILNMMKTTSEFEYAQQFLKDMKNDKIITLLNTIQFINSAHAQNDSELCLYAGWPSNYYPIQGTDKGNCSHPKNSGNSIYRDKYIALSAKSTCQTSTKLITCNPAIFGKDDSGNLSCVDGNQNSANSSIQCYLKVEELPLEEKNRRLDRIINELLSGTLESKKEFEFLAQKMISSCLCDGTPQMNKKYVEYMKKHRTCYALVSQLKTIGDRVAQRCADNNNITKDSFEGIQNILGRLMESPLDGIVKMHQNLKDKKISSTELVNSADYKKSFIEDFDGKYAEFIKEDKSKNDYCKPLVKEDRVPIQTPTLSVAAPAPNQSKDDNTIQTEGPAIDENFDDELDDIVEDETVIDNKPEETPSFKIEQTDEADHSIIKVVAIDPKLPLEGYSFTWDKLIPDSDATSIGSGPEVTIPREAEDTKVRILIKKDEESQELSAVVPKKENANTSEPLFEIQQNDDAPETSILKVVPKDPAMDKDGHEYIWFKSKPIDSEEKPEIKLEGMAMSEEEKLIEEDTKDPVVEESMTEAGSGPEMSFPKLEADSTVKVIITKDKFKQEITATIPKKEAPATNVVPTVTPATTPGQTPMNMNQGQPPAPQMRYRDLYIQGTL